MSNLFFFIRAERWADDVVARHEAMCKRISLCRDRIAKAKDEGNVTDAASALAEITDELGWTVANSQIGTGVRIASAIDKHREAGQ